MNGNKRGEILVFLVLAILILAGGFLIWQGAEITGAEVGVAIDEPMINETNIALEGNLLINVADSSTDNNSNQLILNNDLSITEAMANNSQCGYVNGNLNLSANLVVNGTCFTMNTSNVTVDGRGFSITGNGTGYGIFFQLGADPYRNITLKNFGRIGGFDSGVYLYQNYNVTVFNNTLFNNTYGIYLLASNIDINISSNVIINNSRGINYWSEYGDRHKIHFNNITGNYYGFYLEDTTTTNYNFSNNNLFGNTYNVNLVSPSVNFSFENNWWGFINCTNISLNLSGTKVIDFDPYLNAVYPLGASTACPSQYCGMVVFSSKNLSANLTDCPGRGVTIGAPTSYLDCQGYSILAGSGNNESGVYVTIYDYVNITNCKISNFGEGIRYDVDALYGYIFNNTISYSKYTGIFIRSGSTRSLIINNTVLNTNGSASTDAGISLNAAPYNVSSNNLTDNSPRAFYVGSGSNYFNGNYLERNTVAYSFRGSGNHLNSEIIKNHTSAILVDSDAASYTGNIFSNCQFINNTLDVNLDNASNSNITVINSTINKNKLYTTTGNKVLVKWYVDVNVTNQANNPLSGANVTAYNSLGDTEGTSITDTNGASRLTVTEFYRTGETNYYLTPTSIEASKVNFTKNTTSISLVDQTYELVNLTLTAVTCGNNITTSFIIGNNYFCGDSGFIISANNIKIDGNGYNLTGNGSGMGISLNNRYNVTITNLQVQNFTYGLYLQNSNLSNLTRLTLINNSIGLLLNNSQNNNLYHSTFGNNTNLSLYTFSDSATNNSLVNVTIVNLGNLSVANNANLFIKWYVRVNATYNGRNPLANANIYGYFNNTGLLDNSGTTDSSGIINLPLTELIKNSSGITYLTPHNVTLSYAYLNTNITNSSIINLTQTNNTNLNLSITLNCTALGLTNTFSNTTTVCPGTFNVNSITIGASNIIITCIDTTVRGSSSATDVFYMINKNNVTINDCKISYAMRYGITFSGSNDIRLNNVNINNAAFSIFCSNSDRMILNNSVLSSSIYDLWFHDCNQALIVNNSFTGAKCLSLRGSNNNTIINNTFSGSGIGILFQPTFPTGNLYSANNSIYYNNFTTSGNYINYETTADYNNTFNTSVSGYPQGNYWADYCGKGSDANSDGYADAVSSSGNDWPYTESVSTKISASGGSVIDYGPKMFSCPPSDVYLGSGSSSSTTAVATATSTTEAVNPAPTSGLNTQTEEPIQPEVFYNPAETQEHLQTKTLETKTAEKITKVTVTLENTGKKSMRLLPEIFQEFDDPYFVVTRKTLGFENSFFSRLAGIFYSETPVAGRLLKAEILNPEQIVLKPGEKIEKTIEIQEGLSIPRQIKIQFNTLGETVTEQEVKIEKKAISGTAIDLDAENNILDIYAIIVPVGLAEKLEQEYRNGADNSLTGGAVIDQKETEEYLLELNINRKNTRRTVFSEIYGPYKVHQNQTLVFAQQLKYLPLIYTGDYLVKTRILKAGKTVVENEFEARME